MKTKLLLSLLLSFYFCLLSSQVPQGLNYQALAGDVSGNPIRNTDLQVRISILSDTIVPVTVWEELHSAVRTNVHGIFSLVVGSGVRQPASSVVKFSDINWSGVPLFIKTQIYYQSTWKNMGSAKLWTVPYAMVANNLSGSVKKLAVTGETANMDEALFEVKNKTGQTVFAVYNEGVRVYVDDGAKGAKGGFAIGGFDMSKGGNGEYFRVTRDSTRVYLNDTGVKGAKGGFAIGGFDMSKGVPQDYVVVSPDSIRMYINDKQGKGAKGGFAIGGFDMSKGGPASFLDVATDASGIINPSQNRILWYPIKNAFLAGRVLIEKPDSVGINSFATGYESKAKGQYSQALGYQAVARGNFATSIGFQSVATKDNSFAFGQWALAKNYESYAFGRGAIAEGFRSFAFGSAGVDSLGKKTGVSYAKGDYSFAIGQGSQALGFGSFALGIADTASGNYSLSMGYKTSSSAWFATSFGVNTISSGPASTAMGFYTKATGVFATAIGNHTLASGENSFAGGGLSISQGVHSFAFGLNTLASGESATAMGARTISSGHSSITSGFYTKASGDYSSAMGFGTRATNFYSFATGIDSRANGVASSAYGQGTIANSQHTFALGMFNDTTYMSNNDEYVLTDPVFVIGNGLSNSNRKNAFIVLYNSNVGINMSNPQYKLDIAGGDARIESGFSWLTNSDIRYKKNISTLESSLEKVLHLRGVRYDLNEDPLSPADQGKHIGFIAQELESVVPEVVVTGSDGYKSVAYDKLTAVLTEAIKEQQQKIENQQKEIDELKALVNRLIANQGAQVNN